MKHFSPSEFVDYVEGTLDADRAAHVRACERCGREAEALRETAHETAIVELPEPSPLFWDHFSARVRDEIRKPPARATWTWARTGPLAAAVAAIVIVAVVLASRAPVRVRAPIERKYAVSDPSYAKTLTAAPVSQELASPAPESAEPDDETWTLLKDAAGDLQMDEARAVGLAVGPGIVDRAVLDLSPRERAELRRLIEDEIRHTQRSSRRGVKELS